MLIVSTQKEHKKKKDSKRRDKRKNSANKSINSRRVTQKIKIIKKSH
ncbi:MAG: hypothetical protein MRERV_5c046 [Mycoplasmataceae bacterium RV_VA103A]|nr:MAG: hypothetical protein MRERV_5c046 [Mycoplasmataceae bacterium RV_VA103A]